MLHFPQSNTRTQKFSLHLLIFRSNSIYCQSSTCCHNCQRTNCLPTMIVPRDSCLVYLDRTLLYHQSTHLENWVRTVCCTNRHNFVDLHGHQVPPRTAAAREAKPQTQQPRTLIRLYYFRDQFWTCQINVLFELCGQGGGDGR